MNYTRQFAQHAAITVVTTVLTGILFYVLRIVLYNNLTPAEYGLFYTLFSFVTIVQIVVTFGFDPGLVPYVTQFRETGDFGSAKSLILGSLLPQGLALGVVAAVFCFVPGFVVNALQLEAPEATGLLQLLVLHAVCVLLFKSGQQVLLGVQAIAWRNASDFARAIVCVSSAAWMLHAGWGVYATAIAYTLGAFIEELVQLVAILFAVPQLARARTSWRPDLVRNAFDSGKWLSLAFGGIVVFSALDTVVISLVRSSDDVAAYQVALPTATILYSLMIAAGLSLLPAVRTLWIRGERAVLERGIERLYETAVAVMLPAGVVLACGSDVLMTSLFRADILNAPDAFEVLAVGGIAFFLAYINLHILAGIDEPRAAGLAVLSGLCVYAVLLPAATYLLGIRGAALSGVVGYLVAGGLSYTVIKKKVTLRFPMRGLLGTLALSLMLAVAGFTLRTFGWVTVDRPVQSLMIGLILGGAGLLVAEVSGFSHFRALFRELRQRQQHTPAAG